MVEATLGGRNVRTPPLIATEINADGVTAIEVPDKYATARTHPIISATTCMNAVCDIDPMRHDEEQVEMLDTLVEMLDTLVEMLDTLVEMPDTLVEMFEAQCFERAGNLRRGRQALVTIRVPQTMRIAGDDKLDFYIAVFNSHNGSSGTTMMITSVRVVCTNIQHMAIKKTLASHLIGRTTRSKVRIAQIRQKLGLMWEYTEAFKREAEKMINTELSTARFTQVVNQL
jgi:hypothetical protein